MADKTSNHLDHEAAANFAHASPMLGVAYNYWISDGHAAPSVISSAAGTIVIARFQPTTFGFALMALYLLLAVFAFALGAAVMHAAHARRTVPDSTAAACGPVPGQHPELTALAAASMFQVNRSLQTELARTRQEVGSEKQKTRTLATEARTDKLTGLPNRRVFDEQIELHVDRWQALGHEPVSLILIDVDHFKQINDRYGHPAGDAALQWLANIAGREVGEAGLAVRYGGEEFAVLVPGAEGREAAALAEKLRQAIAAEPFEHQDVVLRITASLGVATTLAEEGSKSLTHRADEALYAAKQNGRNRVYWHNGRGCLYSGAALLQQASP